jgi:carboxypeptidase B
VAGGSTDPCDDSFCGSAPFSEKCVKTVADYVAETDQIVAAVDFHSYSQLWMLPYGYTPALPANNAAQLAMANAAVAALTADYGTQYQVGNIYTAIYPASGSSADDWYEKMANLGCFCRM